jgi:hypothetical protein
MTIDSANPATCPERRTFVVPASVLSLSPQDFPNPDLIEAMLFAQDSQISRVAWEAFRSLTVLKSLCIPASVESIGSCCFADPVPFIGPRPGPTRLFNFANTTISPLPAMGTD